MEYPGANREFEPLSEVAVAAPAAEVLQDARLTTETWPELSTDDTAFLQQIEQHEKCIRSLDQVLERLPNPVVPLEQAVSGGLLPAPQVTKLYKNLATLLADKDYARLALYLPFEFLPGSAWVPEDAALQGAVHDLRESYMTAWYSLLSVYDVRANFVDGDVLEVQLRDGDLPRVVKAAHLIPKLVEAGMLSGDEVIDLLDVAEEPQLQSDIANALLVLDDLGLFADGDLQRLAASHNEHARTAAMNIRNDRVVEKTRKVPYTAASIHARLERIAEAADFDEAGMTVRRSAWLKQHRREQAIADLAEQISHAVLDGSILPETLSSMIDRSSFDVATFAFIEIVQRVVERAALDGRDDTRQLYESFRDDLFGLSGTSPDVSERVSKSFRRMYRLGVVDEAELSAQDIALPALAGPFSKNLELIPDEINRIQEIAHSIDSDPDLSKLIYPVITVGGSRLKGYGEENSDIDLGVFIRPGVPEETRQQVRQMARAKFRQDDDPIEFWLAEDGHGLQVRDIADADSYIADGYWTHMLFGTAWIGNQEAIQELQRKLLPAYFTDTVNGMYGRTDRQLHLERLEQDLLQYRLMHKGYERHYPRFGAVDSRHADLIDGSSVFWDPGYRRLATELFIRMVFLPKVKHL